VPVELAALVAKMMAKEPERRFQEPKEVAQALAPFFKPRANPRPGPSPEVSRVEQAAASPQPVGGGSTPAQPATPGTTPPPPPRAQSKPDPDGVAWESLIEFKGSEKSEDVVAVVPQPRGARPRWFWPAIAAAFSSALIALGVILYIATDYGRIKLVVDGPEATVQIDGQEVLINTLREAVTLRAGKHKLEVKWRGGRFETRKFAVKRGDNEELLVEYEPATDRARRNGQTSPSSGTASRGATESPAEFGPEEPPVTPAAKPDQQTAGNPDPRSFVNSVGMKMKLIPAGAFLMGSPDTDPDASPDERPPHRVRISKPFYLGVHEVTRSQFRRFVEATGYRTEAEKSGGGWGWNEAKREFENHQKYTWLSPGFDQTDEHPVVTVSWNDAVAFCDWLSRTEGKTYRLPTEAEWEYACRAGTTTRYYSGEDAERLANVANVADGTAKARFPLGRSSIAARDGFVQTAPVGRFQPNAFGLYDMHGNVFEWCQDGYDAGYYARSPGADPLGPSQTSLRVFRGGGWVDHPGVFRSANREAKPPNFRCGHVGFRMALSQPEAQTASNNDTSLAGASAPGNARERPGKPSSEVGPAEPAARVGGAGGSTARTVDRPAQAPVGKPPAPPAADRLQPSSVWVAEPGNFTFTILERQGERFKARFVAGRQVREVNGTIKDGRLRWLAQDVKVIAGNPGGDHEGEIKGDEVAMTRSNPGGPPSHFKLRLKKPAREILTVTNSVGMTLKLIPAGEFVMGSPDSEADIRADELPPHVVRITRPFFLGATEVTQGQYKAVTGQSPSHFKGSDDLPVENLSWIDALKYCNELSRAEGLPLFYKAEGANVLVPDWKGKGYRLPTEAEWEYACRAGSRARYSFGDDAAALGEFAWFLGNSGRQTHPVGQKLSNAFGLFDMHGNVWEWCSDGYDKDFYGRSPGSNPVCPFQTSSVRVMRGGCWLDYPQVARSAHRGRWRPDGRSEILGFRVARGQ
jgi:formylglycine-generating enzyme required for sulfatase activity